MTPRYCTICRNQITDERRLRRGSPYCSDDCRRLAKNEKRDHRAEEKCRLCGRKFRRKTEPSGGVEPKAMPDTTTPSAATETSTVATVAQPN